MLQRARQRMPATEPSGPPFPVAENCCSVMSNRWINSRYQHLVLAPPEVAPEIAMSARAGQFFNLLCPSDGDGGVFLRRPMSVYRVDRDAGRIEFLYKPVGAGTKAMSDLSPGDEFDILGPLGNGFTIDRTWREIVVLGRGVGLATLAPLAEEAALLGVHVTAILSAAKPEYLMSRSRFESHGAEVIAVTDEEGNSDPVMLEALLEELIRDQGVDAFFTCGSDRLMQLLKRLSASHGIPGQVALEQQMACGLGMCFCCVRSFEEGGAVIHRRVCCEGPVFDLRTALSW